MKGVDVIAEILRREGTEFLFGYPRTPLIEACAKLGIRPVLSRQERVGFSIADGLSRTTNGNRIGVVATQHGPGSENAFPGIAQAFAENVPMLVIPGGESLARQFTRPMFSAVDNYRHVTKWLAQASEVARIPDLMRRAYSQLRTGKSGPVLIEVPRDVWEAEFTGELDYTPVDGRRSAPAPDDVTRAADMLVDAKNLVILAGALCGDVLPARSLAVDDQIARTVALLDTGCQVAQALGHTLVVELGRLLDVGIG